MPEQTQQRATGRADVAQYRRRMLLALMLLLTALVVMLVKDRSFWFGAEQTVSVEEMPATSPMPAASDANSTVPNLPLTSAPVVSATRHASAKHSALPAADGASVVAMDRGVLPPLEVEVVNGKTHHKIQPDANAVKVDMQSDAAARELAPVSNAIQRTRIDTEKSQPAQPSYPSLAGQMRVQGSVLLQALVRADGVIQEVRVISGPAILSSAAREAAMQWRFKPYLQNGKPVETQARITVNFVIKVWDDEARIHETTPTQTAQATRPGE